MLDAGTLAAGTSVVLDVTTGGVFPQGFPAGTWDVRLEVASTNAAVPPPQIVHIDVDNKTTVPSALHGLAPPAGEGPFIVTGAARNGADKLPWDVKTNVTIDVYLPYRDDADGAIHANGLYDPTNPNHHLLVDPIAAEVALWRAKGTIATAALFYKAAGSATRPATGTNAGHVIEWVAQGGIYRFYLGVLYPMGYSNAPYFWTLAAPWSTADPPADGEAVPLEYCYDGAGFPQPDCHTRTIAAGHVGAPAFWAGFNKGHYENEAYQPNQSVPIEWALSNPTARALSGVDVYIQVPDDGTTKHATFVNACWANSTWYPDHPDPLYWTNATSQWAIYVSSTPASRGSPASLQTRTVPAPGATWIRCDDADGKPVCCSPDDIAALGIDPATIEEVRFSAPAMGPQLLWFYFWASGNQQSKLGGSVALRFDALDSVGNENPDAYDRHDMTGAPLPAQLDADADGCPDACERDSDGDGVIDVADCAPGDANAGPCAPEVCNGYDDNCDGIVDGPDATALAASCDDGNARNGAETCPLSPLPRMLQIHEVMVEPVHSAVPDGQWTELYNGFPLPQDLTGWTLVARESGRCRCPNHVGAAG